MTYRPTVRYDDIFRTYVNDVFYATTLDRNQILRAALFTAALSPQFNQLLSQYKKADVPLPSPKWDASQDGYWKEKNPNEKEGGKDANAVLLRTRETERITGTSATGSKTKKDVPDRCKSTTQRRKREIPSQRIVFNDQRGITIRIG